MSKMDVEGKLEIAERADGLVWYDIRQFGLEGRGWSDTEAAFDRLPARAKDIVRPPVWDLSHHSAGIELCGRRQGSWHLPMYCNYEISSGNYAVGIRVLDEECGRSAQAIDDHAQEGLEMLRQIAAMLTSLAKAVSKDT